MKHVLCLFMTLFMVLHPFATWGAEISTFTPQGSVKEIKQVVARFKTEMVPMGDPKAGTDIFDIRCFGQTEDSAITLPKYSTQWADSKAWTLMFDEPLASGTNCVFETKDDVLDLAKSKLKKSRYTFGTGGPRVLAIHPANDNVIENDQYFIVQFDGDINPDTFMKLAFFEVQGINEKVKVKIVTGSERASVIDYALSKTYNWYDLNLRFKKAKKDKKLMQELEKNELSKFIIVGSERKFPDDAKVILRLPRGITSLSNVPTVADQDFSYQAIKPFSVNFSCSRVSETAACNPIENFTLYFSYPLRASDLEKTKIVGPNNQELIPTAFKDAEKKSLTKDSELQELSFKGPFAEKAQYKIILPKNLKDIIGRSLTNQNKFPLEIKTEAYAPLIRFNGRFGILEWIGGANLPVSVRNIEQKILFDQSLVEAKTLNLSSMDEIKKVISLYTRAQEKGEWPDPVNDPRNVPMLKKGEGKLLYLPKPSGENEYEMMGIPLVKPGFYAIEVRSPRLGAALTTSKKEMYVSTTALVTNMAVHFKKGEESSLVWVTALNDAKPVEGAQVSVRDCAGVELANGVTTKDGFVKLKGLTYAKKTKCENYDQSFYVFAKKGEDFSFVNSNWQKGIESYRYGVNLKYAYEENIFRDALAHTVLDRTLFRPEETVSMKHYFREHHEGGFKFLRKSDWPVKVMIKHSATDKTFTLPITVDAKSYSALTTFKLPADAPLGLYAIYLSTKKEGKKGANGEEQYDSSAKLTSTFTIADYRLPLMQGNVKILGEDLVVPEKIDVDLSAQYLSGGPASNLNVKIRKQILNTYISPEFIGAEDYSFYADKVKPGVVQNAGADAEEESESVDMKSTALVLDKNGGNKITFNIDKFSEVPKRVQVEMEYTDPNGEIKSSNNFKTLYPSKLVVGVKVDSWITEQRTTKLDGVVVDLNGVRASGVKYKVVGLKREFYSHRKRLVGGFYSYDSKQEYKDLGVICEGVSDKEGTFSCLANDLPAGYITLQAEVIDDANNPVYASNQIEVYEKGVDVWWSPGDSDRIDLLPEKKMADVGETLKVMVKTPFKEATALVTIEREGVLDSFVTTLKRDQPVINIPIKKNYAPNVYVSVTLVRGRIAEAKENFLVDLNRPALKMGLIDLKVGWKPHLLSVHVATNKKRYTTREKVDVTVTLKKADGTPLPKGSIVTLAAFDESLLLLKKNETFDILSTMMGNRPLAVTTASGQNEIIGRRHFGSKAKNPGGGGGQNNDGSSRELFDTLLAFIPNVTVGDDGVAKTSIKLNDSMTNFRIVAVATSGPDLFGYGKTNIESTKDLIIYSGAAPLVRNKDTIVNNYTVRNTTAAAMKVEMDYSVAELGKEVKKESFSLEPSESKMISFTTNVPDNVQSLTYEARAKDSLSGVNDGIKNKILVEKELKDSVLQATLFQLEGQHSINVKEPKEALSGSGGIKVSLNKSLVGALTGVKTYMEEYPYSCLEQQISKAVVMNDQKALNKIAKGLPTYFDQDGLLKFFVSEYSCGSEMLSVYVLAMFRENKITIPSDTLNKMTAGLKTWLDGKKQCHSYWSDRLPKQYYDQQKVKVLAELSHHKVMATASLQSLKIDPDAWTTETNLSFRKLLKNDVAIPNRETLLTQVDNVLKARMNFQGTLMNLQNKLDFSSQWMLMTSSDQEAHLYLLNALDNPDEKEDAGRMARGVIARLQRGIWDSTMANAWGVTALRKFSSKYESTPVTGKTEVGFASKKESVDWTKNKESSKIFFNWDKTSKDKEQPVTFKSEGTGKPWVSLQTLSAMPLKAPLDLGYAVSKKMSAVEKKSEGKWSVGDVVNVEITVKAKSDQSWVVINDPIPGGASHLGSGLDGESMALTKGMPGSYENGAFPEEYSEKKFSGIISYAGYLPQGTYKFNYRYRLNSAGRFKLPHTRVEALYAQEVFGELPNAEMVVE